MRRTTILLVGGATAAALALGGLVGGVLAESKGSPAPTAAPVALADRALSGAAAGIGASATQTLETRVRAEPEDARYVIDRVAGVDGFYGASSTERLPTETAIRAQIERFKKIRLPR